MGLYIILIFLIFFAMIGITLYVTGKNKKEDTYTDLDTDEWNCPECGFLVQVGDQCIYCGTEKSA